MVRITAIFLFCLFLNVSGYAQGYDWVWGRGSIGNNVTSWPVATDTLGNVFAAGVAKGAVSFDGYTLSFTESGNMCVLAKYDGLGNFLWSRSTQNGANAFLINITTDRQGNCYMLGWMLDSSMIVGAFTLHNTVYPSAQYFIAKFDPAGNVTWAKNGGGRYGVTPPQVILDSAYTAKMFGIGGIATDTIGNVYVTTSFNLSTIIVGTTTLTNKAPYDATDDILLVKYDTSGNVVWSKSSGGSGMDIPFGLTVTRAGDIYIAGMFNSDSVAFGPSVLTDTSTGLQQWNAFIARYTASGSSVWASGSGGAGKVYAAGVTSDAYNNVYLTGGTADSIISFGGTSITDPYPGSPVLYLVKFDTSNNTGWYKTIGSPTGGIAYGYSIAAHSGNVWVSGAFSDEVEINAQLLKSPSASIAPIFIAGFDTSGGYISGAALQSGSEHQAGIACDAFGSIYLCSDYRYPCAPFIIANDVLATVSADEDWQYLAKYTPPSSIGPGNGGAITLQEEHDTSMCPYDIISLKAPAGYTVYQWNDGSSDSELSVTGGGIYSVKAIANTDIAIVETYKVATDSSLCNCNMILPNAFTPNNDGRNDTYGPLFTSGCAISRYAFSIYNRWGQRVFYTENPYARWDGTFENKLADLDVYKFYLIYSTNPNYPEHVRKGDVTLVR